MKFQEFGTFGICQKLSKNGRYSRHNLSKFVIFENCLVYWIMLHYMHYLIILSKNDNYNRQSPKKNIYQLEKVPDFDLSIPPTISTKTAKKRKNILLKTKYQCNRGFISMVSDAPKLSFRKAIL